MKIIIDIPITLIIEIKEAYSIQLGTKEIAKLQKAIKNGVPLEDIKAEMKARLWRWKGKERINIDKVAMETIINEVLDKENA